MTRPRRGRAAGAGGQGHRLAARARETAVYRGHDGSPRDRTARGARDGRGVMDCTRYSIYTTVKTMPDVRIVRGVVTRAAA